MVPLDERAEFERYSRQRLYPPITNPSWLVLRGRRRIFTEWLRDAPSGLNVLDIGGALQPYRPLLPQEGLRYTAVDLTPSPLVDRIACATDLPFDDDTFDLAICTQVLEYVSRPAWALDEIRRVLKPGGRLLASVPAIQIIAEATDKWRFTPAMLCELTKNYSRAEVRHEVGAIASALRTLNMTVAHRVPFQRLWHYTLFPVLNAMGAIFEPTKKAMFSANYAIQAWK